MRVYRLCKTVYSPAVLAGEGGLLADGRWHGAGRRIVYTATSEALAVLELRVHLGRLAPKAPYTMHTIELPDELVELAPVRRLPKGWQAVPVTKASQQFGDAWLAAGQPLALRVPSIHSRSDGNVLINPAAAGIERVRVVAREPYAFDARLF